MPRGAVTVGVPGVSIPVTDADLDAPSVTVGASASNGDAQTRVLPQVAAGQCRLDGLPVPRGAAAVSPGNGRIDLVGPSPAALTPTLRYTDFGAEAPCRQIEAIESMYSRAACSPRNSAIRRLACLSLSPSSSSVLHSWMRAAGSSP